MAETCPPAGLLLALNKSVTVMNTIAPSWDIKDSWVPGKFDYETTCSDILALQKARPAEIKRLCDEFRMQGSGVKQYVGLTLLLQYADMFHVPNLVVVAPWSHLHPDSIAHVSDVISLQLFHPHPSLSFHERLEVHEKFFDSAVTPFQRAKPADMEF
jgi:hypothetical protein